MSLCNDAVILLFVLTFFERLKFITNWNKDHTKGTNNKDYTPPHFVVYEIK